MPEWLTQISKSYCMPEWLTIIIEMDLNKVLYAHCMWYLIF